MRSNGRKTAPNRKCGQGRTCDRSYQAGVRLCQGALSRAQKEHPPPAGDLRTSQSVHGAPASAALLAGVVCPLTRSADRAHTRGGNPSIPMPAAPIGVRAFCHGGPKNRTIALACPAIRGKTFSRCELPHTSRPIPERCCLRVGGSGRSSGECRLRAFPEEHSSLAQCAAVGGGGSWGEGRVRSKCSPAR